MEKSRLEIKVGVFVLIGLVLIATLMVWFSKGASLFNSTYVLKLHTANVGGLKPKSAVELAGVGVGTVERIRLDPSGTNVTIDLQIYKDHPIYHDARFVIESSDFLGDQFVSVVPTLNTMPLLTNGEDVQCEAPFNLQEVARGAAGFIARLDDTARKLDSSVTDLRAQVLNAQTLASFGSSMTNLRSFTEQADQVVSEIHGVIGTNAGQVSVLVSNFVLFSSQLNQFGNSASNLLATNGDNLTAATRNIQSLTEDARKLLADIQAGQGLAGALVQNGPASTNLQVLAENLSVASSNLNRFGLWHFLWSHPAPATNTARPVTLESPPLRQ
jgi:phospholipid/cholesterol/gamma-HCH transport system substrate-binding protein